MGLRRGLRSGALVMVLAGLLIGGSAQSAAPAVETDLASTYRARGPSRPQSAAPAVASLHEPAGSAAARSDLAFGIGPDALLRNDVSVPVEEMSIPTGVALALPGFVDPALVPPATSTPDPAATTSSDRSADDHGKVVPAAPPLSLPEPSGAVHEQRGRAALQRLGFNIEALGYTISFHPGRAGYRALTFTQRRHIEIYVRDGVSDAELVYIVAHELGHAVDHMRNSRDDRARWRSARGIPETAAWWPDGGSNDLATPAGDFAECFASWLVGSPSHSVWGECGPAMGLLAELAHQ